MVSVCFRFFWLDGGLDHAIWLPNVKVSFIAYTAELPVTLSLTCFHTLPIDLMQDLATKLGLKETVRWLDHLVEKCLDSWGVQWSHGEAFWYCMDLLIHWIAFTVVMFNLWWIRVCSSIGRSHKTLKSQILASSFLQKKSRLWALYFLEVDVSIWLSVSVTTSQHLPSKAACFLQSLRTN